MVEWPVAKENDSWIIYNINNILSSNPISYPILENPQYLKENCIFFIEYFGTQV